MTRRFPIILRAHDQFTASHYTSPVAPDLISDIKAMLEISPTLESEVQTVKSKIIATAAILVALGFLHPHPALSQPATDGGTKPGFWQPQAQVDNTRNITLRLLNETGLNLEYGQSGANLSSLPVGASKNLIVRISNRTGDIANIPINATIGTTTLKYDYNVDSQKNIVTIRITRSDSRTRQDRSVYIDEKGRVYSF
ncbi:MAG TPA: hypothetical protein VIQ31_35265 [Phormidium sp.]